MKREIREEIEDGHHASPGVLRDFCDGIFVRNHPLVMEYPETLLLAFYFDDLETANPLGSRRGKQKLGKLLIISQRAMWLYSPCVCA